MHAAETAVACEQALAHLERAGGTRLAIPVRARLLSSIPFWDPPPSERRLSGWR